MDPAWTNFKNICFTICTWPNRPVGAKILSGFQIEGKTDVWISQVRRVKKWYLDKVEISFECPTRNSNLVMTLIAANCSGSSV